MKKIRLYLDTSVISHLEAPDTPEKMQETLALWTDIKVGKYEIFLSRVVFDELDRCHQPKKDYLANCLNQIEFSFIEINDLIKEIANEIVKLDILKEKQRDDCLHIGSALYEHCDCIVSWNFKHLVNIKTVNGVRIISSIFNYKPIDIFPPTMLIKKEDL